MAFFPFCSLTKTHGLWFLVHPTTLVSIKPLPLFSQPFSALTPFCKKAQHACHVVTIDKGLQDPSSLPKEKQAPTPCSVNRAAPRALHKGTQDIHGMSEGGTGELLEGWAEFFCPAKPKSTATLQFHNRRL